MGGEKKPLVMSDLGCADGCGRQMGAENWTAADGVGARGWLEMGGEKKPLVMSDLGCADGCGRQMGAENCADGCGRRGCNGVAGNGWGEGKGRERMGTEGTGRERKGQEGKGRERMGKAGKGKKPLVMSDLGCADGCGLQMGAENCADGCGRRGCKGVAGNGWREEAAGDERPWLRGRLRTGNGCGELRGRLRTAWVQRSGCRNGWGEEAAGDERPWLRGRLRTANALCGELRGRLRTAWVQGGGWKWVGRRSGW